MLWTKAFWKGLAERALKTFAQTLGAVFIVGVPIFDIDIQSGLAIAATATAGSILMSIGNADFTAGKQPLQFDNTIQ